MKSYSFIRETTPAVLKHTPQKGNAVKTYWHASDSDCRSLNILKVLYTETQLIFTSVFPQMNRCGIRPSPAICTSCFARLWSTVRSTRGKRLLLCRTTVLRLDKLKNQYPHCLLFPFRNPYIRWNYVGMNCLKVGLTNTCLGHISPKKIKLKKKKRNRILHKEKKVCFEL